jgi:hypothetical protein
MCELPKRSLRSSLDPARVVLGLLAIGAIVAGVMLPNLLQGPPFGDGLQKTVLIGGGLLTLVTAVFMPAVREVQLGLSPSVKLASALKDREAEFLSVFERQKGDMEYCAHLLCEDPELARQLLAAAWSQSTLAWKGPITPQLRIYTLCVFVHMLQSHEHWTKPTPKPPTKKVPPKKPVTPLAALPIGERVTVVLHEFANLTVAEIAGMTDQETPKVAASLAHAEATVARLALNRGRP